MAPKKKAAARKKSARAKRKTSASRKAPGPRKASPASIAARDAYVERRPMRGFYLDADMVDYIEEMRRAAAGPKIPSASEIVRLMLRDFMDDHPIADRGAPAKRKPAAKK